MPAPVLVKEIPTQAVNEGASFGPLNLRDYFQAPEGSLSFQLANPLPPGLIFTAEGILSGIPETDTQGDYEIIVRAKTADGEVETRFALIIEPNLNTQAGAYADQLKTRIWEALGKNMPLPQLEDIYKRPISILDVYYILERWAPLTIWNAFDLEPAGPKSLINLPGASPHYLIYDRGSCLTATPKELFSHERTLADSIATAKAMGREVYKRSWTIEFAGFEKMVRAAWVEIKREGDLKGKPLEVLYFKPTPQDERIYQNEARALKSSSIR